MCKVLALPVLGSTLQGRIPIKSTVLIPGMCLIFSGELTECGQVSLLYALTPYYVYQHRNSHVGGLWLRENRITPNCLIRKFMCVNGNLVHTAIEQCKRACKYVPIHVLMVARGANQPYLPN